MPLIRKPMGIPMPVPPVDAASMLSDLDSADDNVRWAAARALPGTPGGIQALGRALARESNSRVREAMFTNLVRHGSEASVAVVLPFLRGDDVHLRTGALDALRAMKIAARPFVPQLLSDTDSDVRLLACEMVRVYPSEDAVPLLCNLLASEVEANVCASAIEVLSEIGGEEVLPVLADCAQRFRGVAFIEFAIALTSDRIRSSASRRRE